MILSLPKSYRLSKETVKNRRRHSGSDHDHFAGRRWDNNLYDYDCGDAATVQTARHESFGVSGNSDARFGGYEYYPVGRADCEGFGFFKLDTSEVFTPLIPAMIAGILWVIAVAYILGKKERKRLGVISIDHAPSSDPEATPLKRPALQWFNLLLTIALMAALITSLLPLPVLFMTAFAIALMVNYPNVKEQQKRISAHAGNALNVVSMVFAAGIFTGILSGTKMVDAMAHSLVSLIPDAMGPHLPLITAIVSMPFTFFMSNDAFYFGVLPIIAEAASAYGIDAAEIGRASLLGQPVHLLSPLVPSTYLLVGMAGVSFGDHQKFTIKWAVGTTIVMTIAALLIGIISF